MDYALLDFHASNLGGCWMTNIPIPLLVTPRNKLASPVGNQARASVPKRKGCSTAVLDQGPFEPLIASIESQAPIYTSLQNWDTSPFQNQGVSVNRSLQLENSRWRIGKGPIEDPGSFRQTDPITTTAPE